MTHRSFAPRGEDGFTLAELLIVLVMLGILLAVAVPAYMGFTRNADSTAKAADAHTATVTQRGNSALDGAASQSGPPAGQQQQSATPPPPAAGQPGTGRVGARPVVPPQRGRPSAPVRPTPPGRR